MPDFGRSSRNDDPSLDAVLRSDRFVDALSTGRPLAPQDPADAVLATLLEGWRDETRWPPATGLISEPQAVSALRSGVTEKQTTRRSRRGLSMVGAAAAAVLCIGGFGAVVAGAGPGDALYGLRTMLFGAPKEVRDDQVALAAKTEMQQVQELITRGDWQQAQDKLVSLSTQVATIDDQEQKQQLLDQWNELSAKVVQRDPEATVPPGITYTVPPSATDLVPAVAPTSVPSAPPITISLPSDSSTESGTSTTPTSPSAPPSTDGATGSPSPTSSPAPSTGEQTTTPVPTPTTTPQTAAPTTTPDARTAATTPTSAIPTSATPTTTPPAAVQPPSVATTPSAVIQQSAVSEAPSVPPAEVRTAAPPPSTPAAAPRPSAPAAVAPPTMEPTMRQQPPPIVITTTAAIPMPPVGGANQP